MDKHRIERVINKLIHELEEEDIGISLLTIQYQSKDELAFFTAHDREKVTKILNQLSEESRHHKERLKTLIDHLGDLIKDK